MPLTRSFLLTGLLATCALPALATTQHPSYGPQLQGFQYPYPVE